jgi:hypothetical protein
MVCLRNISVDILHKKIPRIIIIIIIIIIIMTTHLQNLTSKSLNSAICILFYS